MSNLLIGTGVALITPFKKNGDIDFYSIENIVKNVIQNNVDYLVVLGTTSEASSLNKEEKQDIIDCIKGINCNKLPLILSIGGNNTKNVIDTINNTKNLSSFHAILSVSPFYNSPSQDGIYQHYKSIINNTNVKLIIYNVPKRTGSNILPDTIHKLSKDFKKNIIGIKESSGNILQSYKIIENKLIDFNVISGDDLIALPIILGGGSGLISVIAQGFPKQISDMIIYAIDRDIEKSFYIFYKIRRIIDLIYKEGNPTGIKTLLNIIGLCPPYVRLPLVQGTSSLRKEMINLLKKLIF